MTLPRKTFSGRMAELDFSMKTPIGFVEAQLPAEEIDFSDPSVSVPLLVMMSPVAMAVITVAARPAFDDGTVRDWLEFLCGRHGITLLAAGPGYVGGLHKNHPAVIAAGIQVQQETELVLSLVAMEDGGRLVTAHAMCPRELEPSYMSTLEACIHSLELLHHKGPTARLERDAPVFDIEIIQHDGDLPPPADEAEVFRRSLAKSRDAAIEAARPLVAADRFDEAVRAVLSVDDSPKGRVALAGLFAESLREQVRKEGRRQPASPRSLLLYRLALQYRLSAYPDPHTQDEADAYAAGQQQDRAEMAAILGYEPE